MAVPLRGGGNPVMAVQLREKKLVEKLFFCLRPKFRLPLSSRERGGGGVKALKIIKESIISMSMKKR